MELLNGIDNNQIITKDFLIAYVKSVFYRLLAQLFQIHYKLKYQIIFMLIKLTKFKQQQQQSILSVVNLNIFNRTSKKISTEKNLVITDGNNYVKCTNIIIIDFFRYFVHKLCNICVYIDGNFIKHKTIINEYKTINTNTNNNNNCNGNSESCQRNSVNSRIIQLHNRSPSSTNQIQKKHHPFCCPYNHHKHHHNILRKQQQSEQHSLLHYRRKYVNDKLCCLRSLLSLRAIKSIFIIALIACVPDISASFHHNIKYSTNIVKTKYGPLRGIIVRSNPSVEAFLGVPYASPPVGSLRYMPPVTPSTWRTTRLADRFSAVCPQVAAVPPNGPEALLEVPRGRLAQLRRLRPLLANQSEDCLYLNLYVPRSSYPAPSFGTGFANDASAPGPNSSGDSGSSGGNGGDSGEKPLAAIVYIHGESYEWNSGNPYDGSVLAAHGNVIVVTINFRLGVLGFLKTGGKGSAQGNYGLMDLVAGLHWLRENLPAFGGDPNRVTIMGHGTGAALANVLIVSPVASDLVHRAILLSGSALSPWAIQKDPLFVKRRVAEQTGCHGDLLEDDLAPCLRTKPISELLAVKIDSPRFLPGFAPFIDGTVIAHPSGGAAGPLTLPAGSAIASTYGIELADFPTRELIFGLTTVESYLDLSAQDLEFGFNETRRDRILRTYVRNVYHFHLNEIYSALKNEYTDWERPGRSPMGSRDAALELLSDGHTAAPLVRLGYLHSLRGGRSYFLHFRHQSGERDYPQRGGSVRGEDVPFCLGLPISPLFPHNYTKQDIKISRILIRYISNFAQTGNPNETPTSVDISHIVHSKSALVASALTSSLSLPASQSSSSLSMSPLSGAEGGIRETGLPSSSSLIAPSQPPLKISGAVSSSSAGIPSASLSSSLSIVKHVNDQYLSQLSSSSLNVAAVVAAAAAASEPASASGPAEQSSVSLLASSGGDSTAFLVEDDSMRTSVTKPKSKRHAISTGRRKRKTSKRTPAAGRKHPDNPSEMSGVGGISNAGGNSNIGGRGGGTKKLHRKKYPSKPSESSMEESSSSIAADQESIGGDVVAAEGTGNRITGHIGASGGDEIEEEEPEIDEGQEDDEDDEDEDEPNPDEDEFDERTDDEGDEKDSARNKNSHHLDEDDVEKFDRFDDVSITRLPFWDTYDAINQLYLELGTKIEIKNHYRGHKLSMWLSLIPQLHSPGDLSELPMRHHHFLEDSTQYYDGIIRPQIMQRPTFPKVGVHLPIGPLTSPPVTTTASTPKADLTAGLNAGVPATTTECPPNTTIVPTIAATRPQNHQQNGSVSGSKQDTSNNNNLLRRLANSQYQSYTTALTVTIAVGCFLLLLNVLIFAGIYYQREKRANDAKKKEELQEAETRCSASPNLEKLGGGSGMCGGPGVGGSGIGGGGKNSRKSSLQSLTGFNSSGSFGEYSCYDEKIQCKEKHALADICSVELPLKEFKCSSISSPAPSNTGSLRRSTNTSNPGSLLMYPPSYHQQQQHQNPHKHHHYASEQQGCSNNGLVTYQQFQKSGQPTSANVGTSTEQCNQSTQSEQPSVQDVGTSVDEKAVAGSGTVKLKGDNGCGNDDDDDMISPGIPEPPPPPKSSAPYQGGILRQPGPPTTPGSNKKRVQIQEISV